MSKSESVPRDSRDLAVKVLTECYDGQRFGLELLDELLSHQPLPPEDRTLAAELVVGVARHRLTAEHLASRFYRGRWAGLRPGLRVILATAVYQLCWLDRIPDYAAVDQAVRQAKRHGRGIASTVNALLRRIVECRGDVMVRPDAPDPRRYLAIDESRGRLFAVDVFPDPARRPLDYLIASTSHPAWLVERWHRRFKPTLCRQVCEAGTRRPPLVLRPNVMRVTPKQLVDGLRSGGRDARQLPDSDAVLLPAGAATPEIEEIQSGLCQPQDSTSQLALKLSPPSPGEMMLDLCAGVGTKSTQAAELMRNQGLVIAADIDEARLSRIPGSAGRLGLTIIRPTPISRLDACLAEVGRIPDLILIDAPCSNTGVLARRPEARYRASQRALEELTAVQAGLLRRAAELAGPRTRMIYATCSLEQEENELAVETFRGGSPDWRVEKQVFTLPDAERDGGFAALLTR